MRGKGWVFYFGLPCILAAALTVSSGMAQTPPPSATATAQRQTPGGCHIPRSDASTASIVQATGESLQRKRWQPQGGVIQFTLKSFAAIPDKASFFVCFRWKTTPENTGDFDQVPPDRLDRNNDGTTWTVTVTVPRNLEVPPGAVVASAFPLVPLAEVRIVAVQEDNTVAADVATTIGITHPLAAIVLAIGTIILVLAGLVIVANKRLKHVGILKAAWLLRIISTPGGRASLSQLQILLWTLVVAASAVYVMALSGDLIEITSGTLVLLGIAGAAALGAKVHTESQSSAANAVADTAQQQADAAKMEADQKTSAAANAAANSAEAVARDAALSAQTGAKKKADTAIATARAFKNPPDDQIPRWSDLLVNESTAIDGTVTREIDVTRFQMLLFTLITAAFVALNVLTTYVIPEIPTGFLTLMGISNGVYLGAKVTQTS
jgi:hypothetical protein